MNFINQEDILKIVIFIKFIFKCWLFYSYNVSLGVYLSFLSGFTKCKLYNFAIDKGITLKTIGVPYIFRLVTFGIFNVVIVIS